MPATTLASAAFSSGTSMPFLPIALVVIVAIAGVAFVANKRRIAATNRDADAQANMESTGIGASNNPEGDARNEE